MKIAIISCYDQIDYVRTLTLRPAFAAAENVQIIVVKNKHKGLLRYIEVPIRVIKTKFSERPDVYVITFRGYEMLPFLLLIKGRKPLIFDEYINAAEYLEEHHVLSTKSRLGKIFLWWYTSLLKRCRFILADTEAHAEYSAKLTGVNRDVFMAIPVSTDEKLFYPGAAKHVPSKNKTFRVFYYGVMKKLHGLEYMLEAAVSLAKTHPNVEFSISDPRGDQAPAIQKAIDKGAHIKILSGWVPFETLPKRHIEADLSVGGPFGQTLQSQFVITTKTYQILACATPALLAKNKTANEGFKDKQNCLLVPQADAKAIAKAIGWAADHPKELRKIGAEGRKLYEARFSQARVAKDVQRMVSTLEKA